MKNPNQNTLSLCEIRISAPSEEMAFEIIASFESDFTLTKRPQSKTMTIKFYRHDEKSIKKIKENIQKHKNLLKNCEIRILKIITTKIAKEDWAEKWKKHFKVMKIGKKLIVKPSWLNYKTRKNDLLIEIDPGMSFGTGKHETTKFCLEEIEKAKRENHSQSFLDVGCGSGILFIAAHKLGFSPIFAFDNDPVAVEIARENMLRNDIADNSVKIKTLALEDAKKIGTFNVIAANIMSGILIENRKILRGLLSENGIIILAGIPDPDAEKVLDAFSKDFKLLRKKSKNSWTGISLRKI